MIYRKKIIIGVLAILFLSSDVVEAQGSTTNAFDRLCARIENQFTKSSKEYRDIQQKVVDYYGKSCLDSSYSSFATKLTMLERLVKSTNDEQLYREAQALSDALDAFTKLSESQKREFSHELITWGLLHLTFPEEKDVRFRYNNNASKLLSIIHTYGSKTQIDQVGAFIQQFLVIRHTTESQDLYNKRKRLVSELWHKHGLLVYYWSGTPSNNPASPSNFEKHIETLTQIEKWLSQDFLPAADVLSLFVVRDDIGATAATGTIFMSTHGSLRTFVHELGHVIHFTKPEVVRTFGDFELLYQQSTEGQRGVEAGDYATSYHTNHMEDFAELYTEYILTSVSAEHIVDRAIFRRSNAKNILLKKVFYFMDTVFDSSKNSLPMYNRYQQKRSVSVSRVGTKITKFLWGSNWIVAP